MKTKIKEFPFKERWQIAYTGNGNSTVRYATEKWIQWAQEAYNKHGSFAVALSGGATPLAIYQSLTSKENRDKIPWDHIYLFWGDERAVSSTSTESNFRMAMEEGGFGHVGIKEQNIFRMHAEEEDLETAALNYEENLKLVLKNRPLDLVMLGLGEDGHIASLFPHTEALHAPANRLVAANFVPNLNKKRLTLTFDFINRAPHKVLYVTGERKAKILENVLLTDYNPDVYPAQRIGTPQSRALFIIDDEARKDILNFIP